MCITDYNNPLIHLFFPSPPQFSNLQLLVISSHNYVFIQLNSESKWIEPQKQDVTIFALLQAIETIQRLVTNIPRSIKFITHLCGTSKKTNITYLIILLLCHYFLSTFFLFNKVTVLN